MRDWLIKSLGGFTREEFFHLQGRLDGLGSNVEKSFDLIRDLLADLKEKPIQDEPELHPLPQPIARNRAPWPRMQKEREAADRKAAFAAANEQVKATEEYWTNKHAQQNQVS